METSDVKMNNFYFCNTLVYKIVSSRNNCDDLFD